MEQTREAIAQNLAERLCWQAARRDDVRIARRLYRKQVIDGVYRLDEGAVLDDFFHFLHELGVADWLTDVQGTAIQRVMVPFVQYILLYSLKTLCGIESMNALPALLCSDEALMRLVGFKAQQVRHGVCQRGAATRQGPRTTEPICPDALVENIAVAHCPISKVVVTAEQVDIHYVFPFEGAPYARLASRPGPRQDASIGRCRLSCSRTGLKWSGTGAPLPCRGVWLFFGVQPIPVKACGGHRFTSAKRLVLEKA
jgi:hypothetical protein